MQRLKAYLGGGGFISGATAVNVGAQYVIWGTGVIIPLIVAPYVNRVLGPCGVGLLLFCQAFATYPTLVMEYGFALGGAREVAARVADPLALRQYASASWYARLLLAAMAVPASLAIGLAFPELRDARVMATVLASAAVLGTSSEWYFRGRERLRVSALWYAIGRSLTVPLTFVFVHEPGHVVRMLAIGVVGNAVPSVVLGFRMLREQPLLPAVWADVRLLLTEQRRIFLMMAVQSLGASLMAILLTRMLSTAETGYWAVAQRIQGPFWAIVSPFLTATFPRVVAAMKADLGQGMALARKFSLLSVAGATGMAIVLWVLARPLLLLLAGREFLPALSTLRWLSVYLPLVAITTALVQMWLLPLQREHITLYMTLAGVVVGVSVFLVSYRSMGHNAAAVAMVTAEATKVAGYWVVLRRSGRMGRP